VARSGFNVVTIPRSDAALLVVAWRRVDSKQQSRFLPTEVRKFDAAHI